MKRFIAVSFLLFMFCLSVTAQNAVPTAKSVLDAATAKAAKENKNVFVIFHASWCGWCRKMDAAMNDPEIKPFFDNNYVICHLTVLESDDKKNLENPGALELLTKYNGQNQGIPFWLVFDKDGKLLADSQIKPGVNTGCPAQPEEVAYFVSVLNKTTSLNQKQLALIANRFKQIAQ